MEEMAKKKHSERGIISCCIFIFNALLWGFLILSGFTNNLHVMIVIAYLSIFLQFLAFLFGIIGLFHKDSKRALHIPGKSHTQSGVIRTLEKERKLVI